VHSAGGLATSVKTFVTGVNMPSFSKAILYDGQLYYLTTVTSNLLTVIMFYNQDVDEPYRTMFTVSNAMITNTLACYVFRNTKFGHHRRVITTSEIHSRTTGDSTLVMHRVQGGGSAHRTAAKPNKGETRIHVAKISQQMIDPTDVEYYPAAKPSV